MREKLLVVDDERTILDLTAMVLRGKGFEVLLTDNAQDGYDIIAAEDPAVVLLDYMMPKVNGLAALCEIRQRFPQTYVIMFTGKGSEDIAVELMKAGAADYIPKPFSNTNLVERIENVLHLREIELRNIELLEERERLRKEIEKWNRDLEQRVEEKSLELKRAHAEILQSEKLAALGHLSAGMAHEIRNPLNSISLFVQVLQTGLKDDPELLSYSEKVIQEVERIDGILVKLLATSKRSPFQLRSISIQDVIDKALEMFSEQIQSQGVDLIKEYETSPPPILADSDELSQIFSNLFANALFEMATGGNLEVRLRHNEHNVMISVCDTGRGIPQEHLNQVFDPFFTTKKKGTGFGLSVVLRIIKTYGGRIEVKSEPGKGTCFDIRIPLG
ncbi:MAG: response regulator [Desulfuromonadales bacterium]|nr:response regulator [Desulfuromonadales bacterium]